MERPRTTIRESAGRAEHAQQQTQPSAEERVSRSRVVDETWVTVITELEQWLRYTYNYVLPKQYEQYEGGVSRVFCSVSKCRGIHGFRDVTTRFSRTFENDPRGFNWPVRVRKFGGFGIAIAIENVRCNGK